MTSIARELGAAAPPAEELRDRTREAVVAALGRRLDRTPEPAGTAAGIAAFERA
jgi:hypothetical protein